MKKQELPKPPSQLQGRARQEWMRVVPELVKLGMIARIDRSELAFYCITYGRWADAEDRVAKEGSLVKTKSGNIIQHPALGIANTAMKLCHKFAVEFGFTPRSRGTKSATAEEEAPPGLGGYE